ncbi:hypothetical protein Tco_1194912 [Tanacetum coccineum]
MLDKKKLSLTLDDFRTIFHLPQANADNHDSFVTPPSFLDMVPFYKQQLGFTMKLKTLSSFKTTGLLQLCQTLCKIFSKCLTTRVTGWDQPPLQIMKMMYCFVNNIHVDYAELLWEGLYYSLHHPTSSIPYPRFTKIIISHYMTSFPEISRRRYKDKVGMQIPDWMISEEMKHTEHYRMYAEVFGLDVPLTHKSLGSDKKVGVEITNDKEVEITNDEEVEITNVVIPVNVNEEEEEITDEVYELKRREKGKIVEESRTKVFSQGKSFDTLADHLQEVMVESLPTMVNMHIKEQVKKQVPEQVRDQVPVYVAEGLILERQTTKEEMERMIAKAILQEHGNIQAKISSQINNAIDNHIPSQVDASVRSYMSGHILHVYPVQSQTPSVPEQQYKMYLFIKADPQLKQQDIAIWLALQIKFESLHVPQTTCRTSAVRPRDQDDPHDDAHTRGKSCKAEIKARRHSDYRQSLMPFNEDEITNEANGTRYYGRVSH